MSYLSHLSFVSFLSAAWNVSTAFDCVFQKVLLCKSIWPQIESNTAKVEYWSKCVGFTQLINVTTHWGHLRYCYWVYMWKDVMAPEHVPIYLDRVVSQHVSSLKQEWISPKSTYPWSLGQSDATCAWYLQCTCMTLCTHPFIYSWVPWDGEGGWGRGVGFTTQTISWICSKETGHKTTFRICFLMPSPGT